MKSRCPECALARREGCGRCEEGYIEHLALADRCMIEANRECRTEGGETACSVLMRSAGDTIRLLDIEASGAAARIARLTADRQTGGA